MGAPNKLVGAAAGVPKRLVPVEGAGAEKLLAPNKPPPVGAGAGVPKTELPPGDAAGVDPKLKADGLGVSDGAGGAL